MQTHIMEGRVKVLETYPKCEEIIRFYPNFFAFADFYTGRDYIEQKWHVLLLTLYNLSLPCQHIQWKKNIKYWKHTRILKKFCTFMSYFVHLGTFIAMLLRGNIHAWLACTKMLNHRCWWQISQIITTIWLGKRYFTYSSCSLCIQSVKRWVWGSWKFGHLGYSHSICINPRCL